MKKKSTLNWVLFLAIQFWVQIRPESLCAYPELVKGRGLAHCLVYSEHLSPFASAVFFMLLVVVSSPLAHKFLGIVLLGTVIK